MTHIFLIFKVVSMPRKPVDLVKKILKESVLNICQFKSTENEFLKYYMEKVIYMYG